MIEPNWDSATEEDLWKYVGYFLKKNEIDTVLVGGRETFRASKVFGSGCVRSKKAGI